MTLGLVGILSEYKMRRKMGWENYLNKLEGNRKRLVNPIGPARKDGLAGKYDQIISNKLKQKIFKGGA